MTDRVPPVGLVLGAVVSIQFGAALAATLFDEAGAAGVSLLRLGLAAVVLLVLVRPRVRTFTRAQLRLAAVYGVLLGVMNVTFYEALDRLPLGVAVTIEFAGPLGVAVVLSRRRLDLAWAACAAAGIVLLADLGGGSVDATGVAYALAAAACWAGYILVGQRAGAAFDGADAIALAMVAATAVAVVPGVAAGGGDLLGGEILLLGLAVALLSSVIPYTLELEALRRIPANVFGVLMSIEPAVAALAGLVVLGQDLGVRELIAIGLVVVASVGVSVLRPSPEHVHPESAERADPAADPVGPGAGRGAAGRERGG